MGNRNTVLLDADWLLGPQEPSRFSKLRRSIISTLALTGLILFAVFAGPPACRWWLRHHLLHQFESASTHEDQEVAMISMAELLPESIDQVVRALTSSNQAASKLAFNAIDLYLTKLANASAEQRRAAFAPMLHALRESSPILSDTGKQHAASLASRIHGTLAADQFLGKQVLLATCEAIINSNQVIPGLQTSIVSVPISGLKPPEPLAIAASSLNNTNPIPSLPAIETPANETESQVASLVKTPVKVPVPIDRPRVIESTVFTTFHPSLANHRQTSFQVELPNATTTNRSREGEAPAAEPRQRSIGDSIVQSSTEASPSQLSPAQLSPAQLSPAQLSPAQLSLEDASNEVIGIERQKTEDLVALLASVRAKVASAALYELERRGMSPTQLEIAVDLARGSQEARMKALDRLVHQQDFDPTPWLGWLAADRDRKVRFRAVSLLGSINNQSSRTKLRLLLKRERDSEITQHIQQVLVAGGTQTIGNTTTTTSSRSP